MIIGGEECMTVGQLIEHLKQFPQDAPIIYPFCSDYVALRPKQISLVEADERKLVKRNNGVRNCYSAREWGNEQPEFVTAVVFPGN